MPSARHPPFPLRGRPGNWPPLLAGYAVLVAALTLLTVAVAALESDYWFEPVYEVILPVVLFASPPLVAAAAAARGAGAIECVALGAVPGVSWLVAVLAGDIAREALKLPSTPADSPLWAIGGTFVMIGVTGALGGFLLGHLGVLAWQARHN